MVICTVAFGLVVIEDTSSKNKDIQNGFILEKSGGLARISYFKVWQSFSSVSLNDACITFFPVLTITMVACIFIEAVAGDEVSSTYEQM